MKGIWMSTSLIHCKTIHETSISIICAFEYPIAIFFADTGKASDAKFLIFFTATTSLLYHILLYTKSKIYLQN